MKNKFQNCLKVLMMFIPSLIFAQNSKPVISNIHYENNTATKTISIFYDLDDAEENEIEVLLRASYNDGENYFIKTDTAYGDIGFPVTIGTDKVIHWYYGDFWNNVKGKTLRLIADDKYEINIQEIVDQIDTARLKSMLEFIGKPRSFDIDINHLHDVRDTIKSLFEAYNYDVKTQDFSFESNTGTNVIGRKPGLADERRTIVMDAHYDAYFNAPGADDNGSGVVGFLEAARVLSAYDFDKSLEFIGFDQEENFLLGSINYAFFGGIEPWKNIEGVLNYEMIGYYSDEPQSQVFPAGFDLLFPSQYNQLIEDEFRGNFIFLVGNTRSIHVVNAFEQAAINYVPNLKVISGIVPLNGLVAPDLLRSDHAPFWFRGVPGIMITDGAEFRNHDYHTTNDVIENLDFEFMANVTKTCMAAMMDLAGIRHSTTETFVIQDNIITSINNLNYNCKVSVFPNPASHLIKIQLGGCFKINQNVNASIYDLTGKLMLSKDFASNELALDISDLSCGQYSIELVSEGTKESHIFVVNN
ncbi:MAG: M28 family peptidase [Chitinophagales bacterium]